MAALLPVSPLHAHTLALGILTHAYVRHTIPNRALHQRRVRAQHTTLAENVGGSPAAAAAAHAQTPIKPLGTHVFDDAVSPIPDSSFFSDASSPPPATPHAVQLNLGLNLGVAAPLQSAPDGVAHEDEWAPFPKKSYQKLGLLLQRAIQNGCTYDPALYTFSPTPAVSASSDDLLTFPTSTPRFPTLAELRALLRTHLPQQDDFHLAVEEHLVEQLTELREPDDIFSLITSLSHLLIVYSHKLPHAEHQELRALDESCPLGLFVRTLKLQLDGGLFDLLSRVFEALLDYKRDAGLLDEATTRDGPPYATPIDVNVTMTVAPPSTHGYVAPRSAQRLASRAQFDAAEADLLAALHREVAAEADHSMADVDDSWTEAAAAGDVRSTWRDPWLFELEEGEIESESRDATAHAANTTTHESHGPQPPASTIAPFIHECAVKLPRIASRLDPESLSRLVSSLRQSGGSHLPLFYYLCYMKHVASREYTEALEYCYRYFDYFSGQTATAAAATADADDAPAKRPRTTQQYASLALAQLHFSFAHYAAAVTSIQETIKIAQQNKDEQALRLAMELLHKIIETKGSAAGSDASSNLLHRCLITQANAALRSKTSTHAASSSASSSLVPLPQLDAANALMMAKLMCVRIAAPTNVHSSTKPTITTNQPQEVWKAIERALSLSSFPRASSLLASAHVVRSSAWELFGSTTLAHLAATLHLHEHRDAQSLDTVHALAQLALNPAACPTYEDQRRMVRFIKHRYPHPVEPGVQEAVLHAEFEVELARGDIVRAQQVAQHIYDLAPAKMTHFRHYAESLFVELRLSYHLQSTSLSSLFLRLLSLVQECVGRVERVLAARVLAFLGFVLGSAFDEVAVTVAPMCMLGAVLDAHTLAKSMHMRQVEADIGVLVAALHLEMGDHDECERIIQRRWTTMLKRVGGGAGQPQTLSNGAMLSRAQMLLARCEMARIDAEGSVDEERRADSWHNVIRHLKMGLTYASTPAQELHLYYLLARAYEEIGMTSERDECAEHFCRLEQQQV